MSKNFPFEQADIIELIKESAALWTNFPKEELYVKLFVDKRGKTAANVTHKQHKDLNIVFRENN